MQPQQQQLAVVEAGLCRLASARARHRRQQQAVAVVELQQRVVTAGAGMRVVHRGVGVQADATCLPLAAAAVVAAAGGDDGVVDTAVAAAGWCVCRGWAAGW